MKQNIPWFLCVVLGVTLAIKNLPPLLTGEGTPPSDLREFGEGLPWTKVYSNGHLAIWKTLGSDKIEHISGEGFAVTHSNRVFVTFGEAGPAPEAVTVFQNGKAIAHLPARSGMHESMRVFFVAGHDGELYTLRDHDGDGICDTRSTKNRAWIHNHGGFSEIVFTTRHERVKQRLDGSRVVLVNGRWELLPTKLKR